jgi:hypothetical protein
MLRRGRRRRRRRMRRGRRRRRRRRRRTFLCTKLMMSRKEAPNIHVSFVNFLTIFHVNNHSGKLRCDVNLTAFTEQGDNGKLYNVFHFIFYSLLTKCHMGGQIKKNETGGARGTCGTDRSGAYTVLMWEGEQM